MNFEHLRALGAIVETGSFEGAAALLGVTPSAVSQRIKALEAYVGEIVVRRSLPSSPTDAGAVLLQLARQVRLLEADALHALGYSPAKGSVTSVAVNADSLATWFRPVLREAAGWAGSELHLHIEDQDHSSHLLRQGDVLGAVTTDPKPVGGCRVEPLGVMRYIPAAAPELQQRFRTADGIDWSAMPTLRFSARDDMQHRFLRHRGIKNLPSTHTIPSSEGFLEAVQAGLGWGMVPELQLQESPPGTLFALEPPLHHDVPLYWQCWSISSPHLERITSAVRNASAPLSRND